MKKHTIVLTEAGTSIGDIRVEEVHLLTSDGEVIDNHFNVLVDDEVKHPKLDARGVIRALMHYMNNM